ncbi:PEGA domain-containing protein [Candidatus Uhrbacteria bacterium]|nr:PEGA domain-containing protein [Candidatus Uhrbacteria bacterium]
MSKSFRLVVFLIFLLAFLISAPLVVLYTAGYRFDLSHGRIVHTAVLNISSEPRNASIFVDEIPYTDRTPAVLETILPGEHVVRIEKTGYLPWETSLSFESKEARILGPIILFTSEEPTLQKSLSAIVVSPHPATNQFAYVTQQSSWLEVWVVEASTAQTKLLMRLPAIEPYSYSLTWSTNGTYLALSQQHGIQQDLSVVRVQDGVLIDVAAFTQEIEDVWWDLLTDAYLYVRFGTTVTRLDLETKKREQLPFHADLVSTFQGKTIALLQSDTRTIISYQEGETATILTYLPLGTYAFADAPDGLIALEDTKHHRLILLDPQNREQPILLNEEATLWKWSPSAEVLLYSSGYDLKRYVRATHETQTLTRLSTPITHVDWFPIGSALVYQSDGQTIALNTDGSTILSQTTLGTSLAGTFWIRPDGTNLSLLRETDETWEWWTRTLQN